MRCNNRTWNTRSSRINVSITYNRISLAKTLGEKQGEEKWVADFESWSKKGEGKKEAKTSETVDANKKIVDFDEDEMIKRKV